MLPINEKKTFLALNSQIYQSDEQQRPIVDDPYIPTKPLEWVKKLYIEEEGYHPSYGIPLTLYLNLLKENVLDLAAYPNQPLGELLDLENNGLGLEELEKRLNMPFQIIENAKDVFRGRLEIDQSTKKFSLTINEFVKTYHKLGLKWPYSSVQIFGGDKPLTKKYLEKLVEKKLKLKETSKKLMQLAIDMLPAERMHDTDTHFYIVEEEFVWGLYSIDERIFSVLECISEKNNQKIPKYDVMFKCFSNYEPFFSNKTSLITLGTRERTWDIVSVWESDPKKTPHLFTYGDLEFPIFDSQGLRFQKIKPECSKTDPWACIFHTILNIDWIANYVPGEAHTAINKGLFLKNCINATKGKMLLQNISKEAFDPFINGIQNADSLLEEIEGMLAHLPKSNETSIALCLNILELLGDFAWNKADYLKTCIDLFPPTENGEAFHLQFINLIKKYPDRTQDILNVVKGSFIATYVFQRLSEPDASMKTQVKFTIIDAMPGLTYLINSIEGTQYSFKIEPEKTFRQILKIQDIYENDKEFLEELAHLHLLCTDSLECLPLRPWHVYRKLRKEFAAIGFTQERFWPVILDLTNSHNPLCSDMAFHLLRLVNLWGVKQIQSITLQTLGNSEPLYQGRNFRRARSSKEANYLAEIDEDELRGIILPKKQTHISSKKAEREVFQLKGEVTQDFFDIFFAQREESKIQKDYIFERKITRHLTSKLTNTQNPIKATFDFKARQQFEKSLYKLIELALAEDELRSAVHLFRWSLEQDIFLYDMKSWRFVTEFLLYPCLDNSLKDLIEAIIVLFSENTDTKVFQHFLNQSPKIKEALTMLLPRLFFDPKSTTIEEQTNITPLPKNSEALEVQEKKNTALDKQKKNKTKFRTHSKKFIKDTSTVNENDFNLLETWEALHYKLRNTRNRRKEGAMQILSFVFGVKDFEDLLDEQTEIHYDENWSDDLKVIYIKATFDAIKHLKSFRSKEITTILLYLFWKKNSNLNFEKHEVYDFFLKLRNVEEGSQTFYGSVSRIGRLILKQVPLVSGLALGAGLLYGSTVLMKRYFFYEEEASLVEDVIKDIALNTIQGVFEHCLTFCPPQGEEFQWCYKTDHELFLTERRIINDYPVTLTHNNKVYLIKPALPGAKFRHGLAELIL